MKRIIFASWIFLSLLLLIGKVRAQTTEFTYQGSLKNGATAANGNFDFEFALFDAAAGGSQIGATVAVNNVAVTDGAFSVKLDFGDQFPGAARFLEIRVRQTGGGAFTTLAPRQQITSAPYGVKALNAENAVNAVNANNATTANNALSLGGVAASQYVLAGDARLSDARNPLPNSPNYIQNTTTQQSSSSFNISETGKARIFDASLQFNLGGVRIIGTPAPESLFVGKNAGISNTSGVNNSFFGSSAGRDNTTGYNNSFFGTNAGVRNTIGDDNSFFGFSAGNSNTIGFDNSFFGRTAGLNNTTGSGNSFFGKNSGALNTDGGNNSFFGVASGFKNTIGVSNSFFGRNSGSENTVGSSNLFFGDSAGSGNTVGNENTFVGVSAGQTNTTGSNNTLVGTDADVGSANLSNANAFGSKALVTQGNSLVLGSINGVNGADFDTKVGIGTTAPRSRLHIGDNNTRILFGGFGCNSGFIGISFSNTDISCLTYSLLGNGTDTIINRAAGGTVSFRENNIEQIRINAGGALRITTLGAAGATPICRNAANEISSCSSSMRYKSNINSFTPGLNLIKRLRPVSFNWTSGGMLDLGLVAEDVAKVEPLLTTQNDKGETEGVKYDRIGVVLVNAVNEQQNQIEQLENRLREQEKLLEKQRSEIEDLKSKLDGIEQLKLLVCRQNSEAQFCKAGGDK